MSRRWIAALLVMGMLATGLMIVTMLGVLR